MDQHHNSSSPQLPPCITHARVHNHVTNDHLSSAAAICRMDVNRLAAENLRALLQCSAAQRTLPIVPGSIQIDAYGVFARSRLSH